MKKVYIDTETTGLSPGSIAQLALISEDNGIIEAKNYYFAVDSMTEGAMKACGRDVEFYKKASNGEKFSDRADEIYNELSNSLIIAHNIKFDENFLSAEFWRLNKMFTPAQKFDTMNYFTDICKIPFKYNSKHGKYKNPKLEEVVNFLGISWNKIELYTKKLFNLESVSGLHDAQYDTTAMFVAVQVHNERLSGLDNGWVRQFIIRG